MRRVVAALCAVLFFSVALTTTQTAHAAPAWPVVKQGQTSANVRAVQHLLTARGYATTADGVFGAGTKSKVVAFQKAKKLTADGVVGAKTWPALVSTVRQGSSGNSVKAAQRLLNKFGYKLTADGAFGPLTKSATLSFQRSKGISADGVIGPQTWQYLAGSAGTSNPPTPTNCSQVTGPAPQSDTTVVTGPGGYTFRVHKCLASNLDKLLDASAAAGHTLGGWSYRSYESQVALRRQNCGTTYYAIYQMPSSQCSPPTAIPGNSRHERGLALDFNSKGATLTAGAFNWLKANASKYGLKNLPSERWHWSTDGH